MFSDWLLHLGPLWVLRIVPSTLQHVRTIPPGVNVDYVSSIYPGERPLRDPELENLTVGTRALPQVSRRHSSNKIPRVDAPSVFLACRVREIPVAARRLLQRLWRYAIMTLRQT